MKGLSIAAQESRAVLQSATADAIRDHCLARAAGTGVPIAVAVFDHGGDLVSFGRHDGATPATGAVAQWKGRSAAVYLNPSAVTGTTGSSIDQARPGIASDTRAFAESIVAALADHMDEIEAHVETAAAQSLLVDARTDRAGCRKQAHPAGRRVIVGDGIRRRVL